MRGKWGASIKAEECMEIINFGASQENRRLYAFAATLALVTIAYNVVEGVVSIFIRA